MKYDMTDTTFLIPVKYDHPDREANLRMVVRWLRKHFDTNIYVFQTYEKSSIDNDPYSRLYSEWLDWTRVEYGCRYNFDVMHKFHRTKILNIMAYETSTPVIAICDTDIVVDPPEAYVMAQNTIIDGKASFAWPYFTGNNLVVRGPAMEKFSETLDARDLIPGVARVAGVPYGGIIFCDREKFWECGGEDETFISYGAEDQSRFDRWTLLGHSEYRLTGAIFHLEHWRGPDSSPLHPDFKANEAHFQRLRAMTTKQEMQAEIDSWAWRKNYARQ